jgi:hypothetical protein
MLAAGRLGALAAALGGCAYPLRGPGPPPPPACTRAQEGAAALVGHWVGPAADEGTLTLVFGADGRFRYEFSGGRESRGAGRYDVHADTITVRADGSDRAEDWTFALGPGRLRLRMGPQVAEAGDVYDLIRRPT